MPKYLQQQDVVRKLTQAGRIMMRDRVEHPAAKFFKDGWFAMRKDLQAYVAGVWAQEGAKDSPQGAARARKRIAEHIETLAKRFRSEATDVLHTAMRQAYRLQYLTTAWIVDMCTPPNVRVHGNPKAYRVHGRIRRRMGAKEASYPRSIGVDVRRLVEAWFEEPTHEPEDVDADGNPVPSPSGQLDNYLKAWGGSSVVAAGLAAAYQQDPGDAADRIANANAGTISPESAFERIIRSQVQIAVMDAEDDFDEGNGGGYTEQRIWRTMEDERVCDECESQDGLEEADWEYDIPLHPICRCFIERVIVPFQDALGNEAIPQVGAHSMVFRDPATGEVAGQAIIRFDEWTAKQGVSVGGDA